MNGNARLITAIGAERRDSAFSSRSHMKKTLIRGLDKERETKEHMHTTRPPRLEGKSKNAMMNPVKKKKSGTGHADRQV